MAIAIEEALDEWVAGEDVEMVVIDAEGDRAFCAGGDIADLYATGKAGDFEFGRKFWADEYRLNAKIANLPDPLCGDHGRDHHGWRCRHFCAWFGPDCHRTLDDCDAGMRDWPCAGCGGLDDACRVHPGIWVNIWP